MTEPFNNTLIHPQIHCLHWPQVALLCVNESLTVTHASGTVSEMTAGYCPGSQGLKQDYNAKGKAHSQYSCY